MEGEDREGIGKQYKIRETDRIFRAYSGKMKEKCEYEGIEKSVRIC